MILSLKGNGGETALLCVSRWVSQGLLAGARGRFVHSVQRGSRRTSVGAGRRPEAAGRSRVALQGEDMR